MGDKADAYPLYQLEPDFDKRYAEAEGFLRGILPVCVRSIRCVLARARFPPLKVKKLIGQVLRERLKGAEYSPDTMSEMTKEIAEDVKSRLKAMGLNRYKFVVQVVIGEQRGEGVQMGTRGFWDSKTDDYACELYINVSRGEVCALLCSSASTSLALWSPAREKNEIWC